MLRIFESVFTLDEAGEGVEVGTVVINTDKIIHMTQDAFEDESFTTSMHMDNGTVLCVAKPIDEVCKILCGAKI